MYPVLQRFIELYAGSYFPTLVGFRKSIQPVKKTCTAVVHEGFLWEI